jgi:hypothetical protein
MDNREAELMKARKAQRIRASKHAARGRFAQFAHRPAVIRRVIRKPMRDRNAESGSQQQQAENRNPEFPFFNSHFSIAGLSQCQKPDRQGGICTSHCLRGF